MRRNRGDYRKNIIILGSGRSGTSMVAGLFARSGYFMGKALYPGRDSNPRGFFEDPEINSINEDILSQSQPAWAHPGQQWLSRLPLGTTFLNSTALDRRIKDVVRFEPFCLKDPRFSYTLPVWRPFLKNTLFICVFRDPASTVQSILKECKKYYPTLPMSREIALQVWAIMYQHIDSLHRHHGEWVFVHYDQIFDATVQAKLERITGVPIDRSFPDRSLKRSQAGFVPPAKINSLYQILCELAEFSQVHNNAFHTDRVYEDMLSSAQQNSIDLVYAISKFLADHQNHARAHNDLGVLLYQRGAKQEALYHYQCAAQLGPNSITFLKNLADYYYVESGEINKAIEVYNSILALSPHDVEALVNLGHLYATILQTENASELLRRALMLDPQNQQANGILNRMGKSSGKDGVTTLGFDGTPLSSREQTRSDGVSSPKNRLTGKLIMTLLVRDEEDIIGQNIEFHLNQSVDFIIATDNGSVDRTKEILSAYAKQGRLLLMEEPSQDYAQAEWVNRMAKLAVDRYEAEYVFHCDADEFWSAGSGNLKTEIASCKNNVLMVPLINILMRDRGKQEHFPIDAVYAVVNPKAARDLESESAHGNLYLFEYPPKVMFTTVEGIFEVVQGNHNVIDTAFVRRGRSKDVRIYHFPVRSYRHFKQKVINGGSSYERNLKLGKSVGFHWRRWFHSYKKGTLTREYDRLLLRDEQVEELLRVGAVEPFRFSTLFRENKIFCDQRAGKNDCDNQHLHL